MLAAPAEIKLFTSYNRNGRVVDVNGITRGIINPLKSVIVIAGGEEYEEVLKEAYFNKDNYNLFTVNGGGKDKDIGGFLQKLLNATGEFYLDFHLIGIEDDGCESLENMKLSGRKVNRFTQIACKSNEKTADFIDSVSCGNGEKTGGDVNFFIVAKNEECNTKTLVDLFAKSINTQQITAKKCEDYESFTARKCESGDQVIFGENTDKSITGRYFVAVDN